MKAIPWITILILSASCVAPTIAAPDLGLPELHKIQRVTLSPSYSCRSSEDFHKGYENTALFLSAYSRKMNSPELLFNGACKSADWFEAATAGDDLTWWRITVSGPLKISLPSRSFLRKGWLMLMPNLPRTCLCGKGIPTVCSSISLRSADSSFFRSCVMLLIRKWNWNT